MVAANAPPRILIRPHRGLRDGQRVTISAHGFWPEAKVFFSECPPGQAPSRATGCGDQAAAEPFFITDDSGAIVSYRLMVRATANGKPCQPRCVLAAVAEHGELATEPISFE
jgi:hypothetical protein